MPRFSSLIILVIVTWFATPLLGQAGVITAIEPRRLPYFGGTIEILGQNLSVPCTGPHGACSFVRL